MASVCPFPTAGAPVLGNLADYVDCQAKTLGGTGFQSLAGGAVLPAVLTSALVIYVGLIGYRLLFGAPFSIGDAVLATIRAGLVILFCTHWTGYEAVFYRTVVEGPAELVSAVLPPTGVSAVGASDGAARLEGAYDAIHQQGEQAQPPPAPPVSGALPGPVAPPQSGRNASISTAGVIFMVSSVAGALAARVAAGILLALGPILIVFALFDATLGFFEGWLRALGGAALGAAGASMVLALEVAFVEGRLASSSPDVPAFTDPGLMVTGLIFAVISLGVLAAAGRVGGAFRIRSNWIVRLGEGAIEVPIPAVFQRRPQQGRASAVPEAIPSRARIVADAVSRLGRREEAAVDMSGVRGVAVSPSRSASPRAVDVGSARPTGLGHTLRRTVTARRTQSASRRDGRA